MTDWTSARKVSAYVPISHEMAMDYGLIPDDRPPLPPPTRSQRFRAWRRSSVYAARIAVASWVAGFDVDAEP